MNYGSVHTTRETQDIFTENLRHETEPNVQEQLISQTLSKVSNGQLLLQMERLVKSERKNTHLILLHIIEIESRKIYFDLGYDSVYRYLTQHLKYSGSQAYDRMDAAVSLRAAPQIQEKIQNGNLSLTQLAAIGQCFKQEKRAGKVVSADQAADIFAQVEDKSSFDTLKVLANELNYSPKVRPVVLPQMGKTVMVQFSMTEDDYEIIRHMQDLISHSVPSRDLGEACVYLAKKEIQRVEGKKTSRSAGRLNGSVEVEDSELQVETGDICPKRNLNRSPTQSFPEFRKNRRQYISIKLRRLLKLNADNCCQHVHQESGLKCGSKFLLQIDHVIPLARGGSNKVENLRILCGVHNRSEARRTGVSKI